MKSGRAVSISELRERLGVAEAEPPAPKAAPPMEPRQRPRIVWRRDEAARMHEMTAE
ncbi:MAG: hypothetical protein Q8R82_18345 [Hyphomonadaceae bacterium]|nr:hypothetical protein [Hyphomonadaceae bacterium]